MFSLSTLPAWALALISIVAQGLKAQYPQYGPLLDALGIGGASGLLFTKSIVSKK